MYLTVINSPTGLCYGKLEAGILTFVIPGLLLGHLVNPNTEPNTFMFFFVKEPVLDCFTYVSMNKCIIKGTSSESVHLSSNAVITNAVWPNG
jgi:uncharacterized integral membrane protein